MPQITRVLVTAHLYKTKKLLGEKNLGVIWKFQGDIDAKYVEISEEMKTWWLTANSLLFLFGKVFLTWLIQYSFNIWLGIRGW